MIVFAFGDLSLNECLQRNKKPNSICSVHFLRWSKNLVNTRDWSLLVSISQTDGKWEPLVFHSDRAHLQAFGVDDGLGDQYQARCIELSIECRLDRSEKVNGKIINVQEGIIPDVKSFVLVSIIYIAAYVTRTRQRERGNEKRRARGKKKRNSIIFSLIRIHTSAENVW